MPIESEKQATNLIVDSNEISATLIQNKFGLKREVIRNITPGKYMTLLAVETDQIVMGDAYGTLENLLKNEFGVRTMQTVFGADIPEDMDVETHEYNLHITGHLRVEPKVF